MAVMRAVKRATKAAIPPVVFLSITAYFGWNAMQGDRGLDAYDVRRSVLQAAQDDLATATAEHDGWERRTAGLRTSRLDLDQLDERVRAMLNLVNPADLVVPYPNGQKLF